MMDRRMYYFRVATIALLLSLLAVLPSWAGKRKTPKSTPAATEVSPLDRIALAVVPLPFWLPHGVLVISEQKVTLSNPLI
jgi:hypothetical protein